MGDEQLHWSERAKLEAGSHYVPSAPRTPPPPRGSNRRYVLGGAIGILVLAAAAMAVVVFWSGGHPSSGSETGVTAASPRVASTSLTTASGARGVGENTTTSATLSTSTTTAAVPAGMKLYRDSAAGFTIVYPAKWVKFSARLAFGPQVPDGAAMAVGDPKGGTTGDVPVDYIAFMAQSDPQAGGDAGQESATEEMVVSGLRKAGTQWGASLPAQADFHVVEPAKGIKVRGLVAAEITFRMITAEGQAVLMTVVEAGNDTHLCMLVLTCEEGQRQKYKPIFDQTLGSLALTGAH